MKIAILGGAFNPPHLGHQLIAQQILNHTNTDEVWLIPCFKHTFRKNLAAVKHRSAMTKMLTGKKIKYCHQEIKNRLNGDSINLINILNKKYPQHQFSFIIGSDNLKKFKKWSQWHKLITNTTFYVFPRPGFNFNLKKYQLDSPDYKFILIKRPKLIYSHLSSTKIRQRIKKGLSIINLVPKKVAQYIKKNKLYLK